MINHLTTRTRERMQDVLMSPHAESPEVHYYMIGGAGKAPNITIWEHGCIDGEYIKTYGHYHRGELEDTYRVLSGEGVVLLQKAGTTDDVIEDFKVLPCRAGDVLSMPSGYAHVIVNTGGTYLVTSDEPHGVGSADYEPLKRLQGMAYYVVLRDGAPALLKNPRYTDIRTCDTGGLSIVS